ncbi:MAG: ATP-binding protein [Planctomycetota bacterium]
MTEKKPDLASFVALSSSGGNVQFGTERFLLFSARAMGLLRQELYDVLGPIMAHELLFRFGFHDGSNAARAARERMPDGEPDVLLSAGPLVQSLEGAARVKVTEYDRDPDGELTIRGLWEDSYEVEQVLGIWGAVPWTACWVLTGFASGFVSEILQKDYLCIESSCRARGDDECRFELIPAERFPGLAKKVRALREGRGFKERMQPTIDRLSERAFTSSAFLSQILHDSADAVLTVDDNDVIRTFNRGAEALLGYAADEAIGRNFSFLVPEDLQARGEIEKIKSETSDHGSLRNYETRRLRKGGDEVFVSLTRTSIYDAHGDYKGCSAILRDITERKRLVAQLIQAESLAEVGELAAQVAHEIKNPLAGISAAIQLIATSFPEEDHRSAVFGEILGHIHRLDSTVQSLLSYTRLYQPDLEWTDFDLLLDSALSMLENSDVFSDITVLRDIPEDLGPVLADRQQTIQVLMNLLLNSAQAVVKDTTIRVTGRRDGRFIEIVIADRGAGIPPETAKQVFRPFFTSKNKGTGLGLPIARKIVEAHGGQIDLISTPEEGTTVRIRLPAAPDPERGIPPASGENPPSASG